MGQRLSGGNSATCAKNSGMDEPRRDLTERTPAAQLAAVRPKHHCYLGPRDVFMECSEEKEYRPSARGADEEKAQKMYPSRDLNYQGGKCTPSGRWLNSPLKSYSRIGQFNNRPTVRVGLCVGGGYVPSSKRSSPTKLVRA